MFLSIKKGLWYGAKGIAAIVVGTVTLSWLHGHRRRNVKERRRRLLLIGVERRNLFHRIGDLWNYFSKKHY
jgi:hypothetical protein